jgi:hypothetical protein
MSYGVYRHIFRPPPVVNLAWYSAATGGEVTFAVDDTWVFSHTITPTELIGIGIDDTWVFDSNVTVVELVGISVDDTWVFDSSITVTELIGISVDRS